MTLSIKYGGQSMADKVRFSVFYDIMKKVPIVANFN